MKTCPQCKQDTVMMVYGNMFDVDTEFCLNKDCGYEIDLPTMTCYNEDGSISVISFEEDEDEITDN